MIKVIPCSPGGASGIVLDRRGDEIEERSRASSSHAELAASPVTVRSARRAKVTSAFTDEIIA